MSVLKVAKVTLIVLGVATLATVGYVLAKKMSTINSDNDNN